MNVTEVEDEATSLRDMSLKEIMIEVRLIASYIPPVVAALIYAVVGNCIINVIVRKARQYLEQTKIPTTAKAVSRESSNLVTKMIMGSLPSAAEAEDADGKNGDDREYMPIEQTKIDFGIACLRFTLKAMLVVSALAMAGVDTDSFLAFFAAASLAFGLALQQVIEDAAKGVLLITFKPFHLGDAVNINGVVGRIKHMSILTTTIISPDHQLTVVPNRTVMGCDNLTIKGTFRIDQTYRVSNDEDFERVKKLLLQVVDSRPIALKSPAPEVLLSALEDSGMSLIVRAWVDEQDIDNWPCDINEAVKTAFFQHKVKTPRNIWGDPIRR